MLCLVVLHEVAAIHISVTDPMLQGNSPLPADITRCGKGVRGKRPVALTSHRYSAVTWQPPRPVLVSALQRTFDQDTAETGTVDEEISLDLLAALERE